MAEAPKVGPAEAKRALLDLLATGTVEYIKSFIIEDFAQVRRAFTQDDEYANAILAVCQAIVAALRDPKEHGRLTEHKLAG